uniref:Uncharacterized protein n=1 Tax=Otus sunia TaxID=257818 RepID=A0A8C8BIQ4_9STRI
MSDYWYWRLIPCKDTGSCNCFATASQSNEEKEEDTNHQVVVSDIMQLVRDKQEVPESTAGEKNIVYFENCPTGCQTVKERTDGFKNFSSDVSSPAMRVGQGAQLKEELSWRRVISPQKQTFSSSQ